MGKATMAKVNAAIAPHGIYLAKGPGYFWFGAEASAPDGIEECIESVYVNRLADLTLEQWVAHVEDGAARYRAEVGA